MEDQRREAVTTVNNYLRKVREDVAIDARLSLVTFDSQSIDTIRDRLPIARCADLTLDEYQPRAATPLLDAVGYSVGIQDCLSGRDERRIMAILTDGLENASREYTRDKLKSLLDRKQSEGWLIVYMGAGHDSWHQASQIGIEANHTADFSLEAVNETADVLHALGKRFMSRPPGPLAARAAAITPDERDRLKWTRNPSHRPAPHRPT
jgi:hypothetical protein